MRKGGNSLKVLRGKQIRYLFEFVRQKEFTFVHCVASAHSCATHRQALQKGPCIYVLAVPLILSSSTYVSFSLAQLRTLRTRGSSSSPSYLRIILASFVLFQVLREQLVRCGHGAVMCELSSYFNFVTTLFVTYFVIIISFNHVKCSSSFQQDPLCGKSEGFANHRQQGRFGYLMGSRRPRIIDGKISNENSWPWQVCVVPRDF